MFRRQAARVTWPPVRRRRLPWLALSGCVAVALACAGCGGTAAPTPLGRPVNGPILDVVTSAGFWGGGPRRLMQDFPAGSRSAVATVVLGSLPAPSRLTLTWYRLTSSGAQPLFTKRLTVTSYGMAYSTAVAQGTLAPGIYQVRASIDGVTRDTDWAATAPSATVADAARSGELLRAGASGSVPVAQSQPLCEKLRSLVSMPSNTEVRFSLQAYCPSTARSGPVRGVVLATMNRSQGESVIGHLRLQPNGQLAGSYAVNVCSLPDGSNRPGASIAYVTLVYYHGNTRAFTSVFHLPNAHSAPVVTIASSVPAGSMVHPGEKITLRVAAAMPAGIGPQRAVRTISLGGPDGSIASRTYKLAAPCGSERVSRSFTVSYTVPAGAPPQLTLTANAQAGTRNPTTGAQAISFRVSG